MSKENLPKPEDVTLGDLRRLLVLEDDGVKLLISHIPGIDEFERKLNCELLCDLDARGTEIARDMLSPRWGWSRADVDRLEVVYFAQMSWRFNPGQYIPAWRSNDVRPIQKRLMRVASWASSHSRN